jgi:hypothetical protein
MRVTNLCAQSVVAGEKYRQALAPEKSVEKIAMSGGDPTPIK